MENEEVCMYLLAPEPGAWSPNQVGSTQAMFRIRADSQRRREDDVD